MKNEPLDCCGGSPGCALNKTTDKVNKFFQLVKENEEQAREHLKSWIVELEDDADLLRNLDIPKLNEKITFLRTALDIEQIVKKHKEQMKKAVK